MGWRVKDSGELVRLCTAPAPLFQLHWCWCWDDCLDNLLVSDEDLGVFISYDVLRLSENGFEGPLSSDILSSGSALSYVISIEIAAGADPEWPG